LRWLLALIVAMTWRGESGWFRLTCSAQNVVRIESEIAEEIFLNAGSFRFQLRKGTAEDIAGEGGV